MHKLDYLPFWSWKLVINPLFFQKWWKVRFTICNSAKAVDRLFNNINMITSNDTNGKAHTFCWMRTTWKQSLRLPQQVQIHSLMSHEGQLIETEMHLRKSQTSSPHAHNWERNAINFPTTSPALKSVIIKASIESMLLTESSASMQVLTSKFSSSSLFSLLLSFGLQCICAFDVWSKGTPSALMKWLAIKCIVCLIHL